MKISRCVFLAGWVFLILSAAVFGQTITTGDVVGVVSDTTGAVVPSATVSLKSVDTGETRTATTNGQGQYRFPLLKPGAYIVSAASTGLKSNDLNVTLLVGQEQQVNITMTAQGTSTTVQVTTETPLVQTENANLESSFDMKQVQDLPMPGGDLTTLAMTTPGVRVNVTGGSANMNANGITGTSILFTLNGTDEMDPYNNYNNSGASNNLLGANEVAEAAVVVNAYSAQYGRMAGGQVNLVGQSGTNQFHGNVFYNYNWQGINANSFFANETGTPIGRADAHQFGGRFGGPIVKNKVFAFFDDENLRYVLPATGVYSLPSSALQSYTLAHVPAASLPLYQDFFKLINASPGVNRAVPVTNGSGPLQDGNHALGCGTGTMPGTPTGTGGIFGTNVGCALAYETNVNQLNTEGLYTIRVDYNVTNNQKLFFRYNRDSGTQATGTSPVAPVFNSTSYQPQDTGSFNYTWVISPTLVNNLIGSAFWYQAQFGLAQFSQAQSLMPEAFSFADGGANGGTFATVGASGGYPNGRNIGHAQLIDDLAWTHGTHTIKGGFAFRYDKVTYTSIASNAYVGTYTFNDLADFANGELNVNGANLGSSFSQNYPEYAALHFRIPSIDYYLQDEWAVGKSLKLTYGIRFETDFNPTCVEKCFSLLNVPFTSSSYQGGVTIPYDQTITTGHSNVFYSTEPVIPEPRFGFAWSPFGNSKTVVRGGIGLFSTNYTDSLAGTFSNQIPNKFQPSGLTFGNVGLATDSTSTAYAAQQSANAFFSGFSAGDTLAGIKSALGKVTFGLPSFSSEPSEFVAPKALEWSFEIQQQITAHNLFDITYAGNHGYDLQEAVNANMYTSAAGVTRYGGGFDGLPTAAPDGRFLYVYQVYNNGISNYDGLTVSFRHSFSYGLTGQIHYTWSHALGDVTVGSTTSSYYNPLNLAASYGNLGFDNRHQVAADLLWNQPFKVDNKFVNQVIQGWTLSAKMFVYSGAPFSIVDSKISAQINSSGTDLPSSGILADVVNSAAFSGNCGSAAVNTACLAKTNFATYATTSGIASPIQTNFGNVAPNQMYGPGYFDLDTQVMRNFRIKERMTFTIGLDAYNVLNHPNFANPSGSLSSGAFGTITSVLGPPTSIYGSFQGASVSGRVAVLTGRFTF